MKMEEEIERERRELKKYCELNPDNPYAQGRLASLEWVIR